MNLLSTETALPEWTVTVVYHRPSPAWIALKWRHLAPRHRRRIPRSNPSLTRYRSRVRPAASCRWMRPKTKAAFYCIVAPGSLRSNLTTPTWTVGYLVISSSRMLSNFAGRIQTKNFLLLQVISRCFCLVCGAYEMAEHLLHQHREPVAAIELVNGGASAVKFPSQWFQVFCWNT